MIDQSEQQKVRQLVQSSGFVISRFSMNGTEMHVDVFDTDDTTGTMRCCMKKLSQVRKTLKENGHSVRWLQPTDYGLRLVIQRRNNKTGG